MATIDPMPQRLERVRHAVRNNGFPTIFDAMIAFLEYTAQFTDARTIESREVRTFYAGDGCERLMRAITRHPVFATSQQSSNSNQGILDFAVSTTRKAVICEIDALCSSKAVRIPLVGFAQDRIDSFSFELLDENHAIHAPILRSLLMAVVQPKRSTSNIRSHSQSNNDATATLNPDLATDEDFASASDARNQPGTARRNRELIATSALSMLAYAHSKNSNLFQVIMGYFAFSSGVKKRSMEVLHRIGCMVSYEGVTGVLRSNAIATEEKLRERAQNERFLLSFDNLNFYRSKRDQTSMNRAHIVNYTAGYVTFMGNRPHIARDSVDHKAVNQLTFDDLRLSSEAVRCHREAARALACRLLKKYLPTAFHAQRTRDGTGKQVAKYSAWEPPLKTQKCPLQRADILPLPTLAKNEASVAETIEILQEYMETLGVAPAQLDNVSVMINGDLMTVQNINRAVHRRQDERLPEHKLEWAEPVPGLLHTQMTALRMFFKIFWGGPAQTVSICRFANLLRRKQIAEVCTDFHHCNQLFLLLVDALLLALIAHEAGCHTWENLSDYISQHDWRSMIDRVVSGAVDPYSVNSIRVKARENIERQVKVDINAMRAHHEELVSQGAATKKRTKAYWSRKETETVESRWLWSRDQVRENALLFLNNGLIYREFNDACRGGYSGRVIKCVEHYMVLFHGSNNTNYARECINLVAHIRHGWDADFRESFDQFCLINPTGLEGRFHALDRFNEYEIRELKAMIHPSSNPKSDAFFRRTVAFNFISLASVKAKVQLATGSTDYGDRHQLVDDAGDIRTIFNALMEANVFRETPGRGADGRIIDEKAMETPGQKSNAGFVDLMEKGTRRLAGGMPIKAYLARARGNWDRYLSGDPTPAGEDIDEDDWLVNGNMDNFAI